jgi:hypothetical protein
MANIAFRVYHPDGDKVDKAGVKFFGWDETFDEWLPLYSPRIQKFNTYTSDNIDHMTTVAQNKNTTQKSSSDHSNDQHVEDELDSIVSSVGDKEIFAVQRSQCRSDLIVTFLNNFG